MTEVVLSLQQATAALPAVCAMTGEPADGAVPIRVGRSWKRWGSPVVRVPMSDPVFKRWSRSQNIHIKGRAVASVLTAVGVVLAFRSGLVALGVIAVAVAIHVVDLWADRRAKASQPEFTREGANVRFAGVHDNFARACSETVT